MPLILILALHGQPPEESVSREEPTIEQFVAAVVKDRRTPVLLLTACGTGFCGNTLGGVILVTSLSMVSYRVWGVLFGPILTAAFVPLLSGVCVNYLAFGSKKRMLDYGAIVGAYVGEALFWLTLVIPAGAYSTAQVLSGKEIDTTTLTTIAIVSGAVGLVPFALGPLIGLAVEQVFF